MRNLTSRETAAAEASVGALFQSDRAAPAEPGVGATRDDCAARGFRRLADSVHDPRPALKIGRGATNVVDDGFEIRHA
ncbi:MAG: hypothetical protein AB7U61_08680 [Methylocystis sp.]